MERQTHTPTTGRHVDTSNLRLLGRMDDFRVAKDDPDPRGWNVVSQDGKKVGEVDHLLVDPSARRVAYLGVDLDRNLLGGRKGDGHVMVPVESARLGDQNRDRQVLIPHSSAEMVNMPVYDQKAIRGFRSTGTTGTTGTAAGRATATGPRGRGNEEERMTLSEEQLDVRKRQQRAGEVEVDKRVEKERVHESVPVRHEEVVVERQPASGRSTASFEDEEFRIPLTREEVHVEKHAVPKEDIVVKKRDVVEHEDVDATVRKERAEVHEKGDVRHESARR
jgi:uncharacterized protein (TIGR02271 family)